MTVLPPWKPLWTCKDASIPKLMNLRKGSKANLRVPATFWLYAATFAEGKIDPPSSLPSWPLIVRSASPTEDTRTTSNAGQLYSEVVPVEDDFDSAVRRVLSALPKDRNGKPRGAVFVQSVCTGTEGAGIAFFDGFYYERTLAAGGNATLTSGQERGDVSRGAIQRSDAWSDWLASVWSVFGLEAGGDACLDIEFVRDAEGFILLQVRPALFELKRNESLSLANHKEILGDSPSPWIVSVLVRAGADALKFFAAADPEVATWNEAYAVELAGRAWMNVGFFFRLMDRWGMPRTMVLDGVGGKAECAADARWFPKRLMRSFPKILRLQWSSVRTIAETRRGFQEMDRRLAISNQIEALFETHVALMAFALRTNFAINGALVALIRIRRRLGISGAAEIVTRQMMAEYDAIPHTGSDGAIEQALEGWLGRHGHRGPLESDPARPRFAEMREMLLADLVSRSQYDAGPAPNRARLWTVWRPFFWLDQRREWFRDALMRRWQVLRARLLHEGERLVAEGKLETAEDIFYLRESDLKDPATFGAAVRRNRANFEMHRALPMPLAATRDEILALLSDRRGKAVDPAAAQRTFAGIALSPAVMEGRVVKAESLLELLARSNADPTLLSGDTILVVPCLEPSWAIVFPRVGGVAAEIGGELSHAAILLREARRPAIVNCAGLFASVKEGDRIRLDGLLQCAALL